jgi:glutathione peroxidase
MGEDIQMSAYDFTARSLEGRELSLAEFRGRPMLIVNTASKCGFTPQYAGLEALHRDYQDRGLVVLGFPCNQFGAQEPGEEAQIRDFCQVNYGVSFPMFAKIDVNGADAYPLYDYLKRARPGLFGLRRIMWNFTKFLTDRQGRPVRRFGPSTPPDRIRPAIEELL